VIVGLYTRGLAFEYRASWESTFLGAEQVQALLAVTLAPGSWITGIPVPDVAAIEAIRAPASENAATWLHLMAGTVVAVVIVPRLVLALAAGLVERRRRARVAVPLDEPYFRRLVGGWVGEAARVRVIPYSHTLTAEARTGLDALLARAFGNATVIVDEPVPWGDDDALEWFAEAAGATATAETRIPLFGLAATPEEDAHGAFLRALARAAPSGAAIVDESAFLARWPGDEARRGDRRAAWRELIEAHGRAAVFVDLGAAEPAEAAAELADAASALDHDRPAGRSGR
jgi:hypothetical protein